MPQVTCERCGKQFEKPASRIASSKRHYCRVECRFEGCKIPTAPGNKRCSICKQEKPKSDFGQFATRCRPCDVKRWTEAHKRKIKPGLCNKCGCALETASYLCTACKNRHSRWQRQRYKEKKELAVIHKGGECERCGFRTEHFSVYDFHHKDPKEKDILITQLLRKGSWEKIKKGLEKCLLLCSNCHRVVHETEYERDGRKVVPKAP